MSEWILPFPETAITCRHGVKDELHPNGHRGTDFGKGPAKNGAPIPAPSLGRVVISEWHDNLGNVVVMKTPTGKFTYFCHLIEPGLPVNAYVAKAGDPLGKIGNTGHYSFGAHLHCGVSDHARGFETGVVHDIVAYVKEQQALAKKAPAAPVEAPKAAASKVAAKPAKAV
jgi:murein DD-endopeptidase MepM/ murein hydrolase activator NlpD